jgi:hypothetical protein
MGYSGAGFALDEEESDPPGFPDEALADGAEVAASGAHQRRAADDQLFPFTFRDGTAGRLGIEGTRTDVDPAEKILSAGDAGGADAGIIVRREFRHEPVAAHVETGGTRRSRSSGGGEREQRGHEYACHDPELTRESGKRVPGTGLRAGSHECSRPGDARTQKKSVTPP